MFSIGDIISISLTLFAVIDILGSLPILITLKQKQGTIQSGLATIVAGLLMIVFLLMGETLLNFIGIDVSSFAIAGAIIIFIIGLEMILNVEFFKQDKKDKAGSIVPIAFP
ncbi:MAG: MarC family protein, partial [Bacteroidia bacterium]|nr:MarC family protein [Bacteroidia bacterium]